MDWGRGSKYLAAPGGDAEPEISTMYEMCFVVAAVSHLWQSHIFGLWQQMLFQFDLGQSTFLGLVHS